jgi:uncharacterized protein
MREQPQIRLLPDGRRLFLQDGPINLVVEAFGEQQQIEAAYSAAASRFVTVLDELCAELSLLRRPILANCDLPSGIVARRMARAVAPFSDDCFITPMAAVAGAVAEEILGAMLSADSLQRAYVNNGGDIAFHLAPGEHFVVGMIERPDRRSLFGTATLHWHQPVRGIATSGWRGRSFSLGIADAVTILANTAAAADAAATIVANAVDLPGHPSILRAPACDIDPDSDLGSLPVTRYVGELEPRDVVFALDRGASVARDLLSRGLICAAALCLQGQTRVVGLAQPLAPGSRPRSLVHA